MTLGLLRLPAARRARGLALLLLALAAGALGAALRPREAAPPVAPSPVAVATPPAPVTSDAGPARRATPRSARGVVELADGVEARRDLSAWAADPSLDPARRYAALRRLEELDDRAALGAAVALTREEDPFLRTNAIGTLVRLANPARRDPGPAQRALASLQGSARELARALWVTGAK